MIAYRSIYFCTCLLFYLFTFNLAMSLLVYLSTCLPVYLSTYIPIYALSVYFRISIPVDLYIFLSIYLFTLLFFYISVYLATCVLKCSEYFERLIYKKIYFHNFILRKVKNISSMFIQNMNVHTSDDILLKGTTLVKLYSRSFDSFYC